MFTTDDSILSTFLPVTLRCKKFFKGCFEFQTMGILGLFIPQSISDRCLAAEICPSWWPVNTNSIHVVRLLACLLWHQDYSISETGKNAAAAHLRTLTALGATLQQLCGIVTCEISVSRSIINPDSMFFRCPFTQHFLLPQNEFYQRLLNWTTNLSPFFTKISHFQSIFIMIVWDLLPFLK